MGYVDIPIRQAILKAGYQIIDKPFAPDKILNSVHNFFG